MNKFLSLALAAALCAPAFAQKMGMANNDAQTIKQTLMAGEAKISLDYTSITWAQGQMMARLMDKEKGAKAREMVNQTAKKEPLGSFSTSVDVTIGSLKIPAGEYKLAFTINENLDWEINFMGKETLTLKLDLQESKGMQHKRLLCSLFAGDESSTASVYVAFGEKSCVLNIAPAKGDGKKG
jgi:hypothetical protein